MDDNIILFGLNSREAWEDQEKHSYDAKVLEREYEDRLYSKKGRELLDVPKDDRQLQGRNSSDDE